MIRIEAVTRLYGDRVAVDDISLEVPNGQFVALMGPNGAGKSTLLRLVAGLTRPSSGRIVVAGQSVRNNPSIRRNIGLLAHESYLYGPLTARENLMLHARLFDVSGAAGRVDAVLDEVGMIWAADLPIEGFSRGMEQRVALARVMLHDPGLLLLDEPFAGLDRAAERLLAERLDRFREAGKSALLVTHDPAHAVRSADRAVVIRRGRVAWDELLTDDVRTRFPAVFMGLLDEGAR